MGDGPSVLVTLRLSVRDRALLERLVERERQAFEDLGVEVPLSSVMRKRSRAAAKASAVDGAGVEAAAPVAPPGAKPAPTRASGDVSQDQVRALLRRKTAERRAGVEVQGGQGILPGAKLAGFLALLGR